MEHLKSLRQTLRANNLVLNATKTCVAYTKVDSLGYTINQEGIKIAEAKD